MGFFIVLLFGLLLFVGCVQWCREIFSNYRKHVESVQPGGRGAVWATKLMIWLLTGVAIFYMLIALAAAIVLTLAALHNVD